MDRNFVVVATLIWFHSLSSPPLAAIDHGRLAKGWEYPEVVLLTDALGRQICSATIIGKNAILTADHCNVEGSTPLYYQGKAPRTMVGFWGVPINSRLLNRRLPMVRRDAQVLIFDQSLARNFVPASIATVPPQVGDTITLVGFGYEKCSSEYGVNPGVKRVGTNSVLQLMPKRANVSSEVSRDDDMILTAERSHSRDNAVGCKGDSGGPLFLDGRLVGVFSNTFGLSNADRERLGLSDSARTSKFVNLLSPEIQRLLSEAVREGALIPGILPSDSQHRDIFIGD